MTVRRQWMFDVVLAVTVIGLGILIASQLQRPLLRAQTPASKLKLPPIPKGPINYPAIPVQQPTGVPAIHPAGTSLTADEVRQFLTSKSGPVGIKGVASTSVSRVDCGQTVGKLSPRLPGKSVGLPNDEPVCYVELNGTFTVYTPPTTQSPRGTPVTFHTAFRVFDAKTGNVLVTGALNHPAAQ